MNGAHALIKTLLNAGVEVCFSNPGTSEMHFVGALDEHPQMRCVLGLFEGVVTGAADGYARMAGKPAATLLHLGPGLGNGLANLHNAKRGKVPMVNIVGDHASYHLHYDAPLTSDIEGVARPMSHWVKRSKSSADIARDGAEAVAQARRQPGQIATLILPADVSWNETQHTLADMPAIPAPAKIGPDSVAAANTALGHGKSCLLLLGGTVDAELLEWAGAISARTGARLAVETFATKIARGAGLPALERVPYIPEFAVEFMRGVEHIVLVGTLAPVSFFAYPELPSNLVPEGCQVNTLVSQGQDITDAIAQLAAACGADRQQFNAVAASTPELPAGDLNANTIAQSIAAQLPADTIIVDEGIIGGSGVYGAVEGSPRHDWILQTGGSIGWGLPAAVGAAIACPDRKVLCLEGDGSAMYTIQALWTMAREQLDITTIIFANRQYAILQLEYARVGASGMGANAAAQLSIGNPDINYAELAKSMGVSASRAHNAEEFNSQLAAALATKGPHLIEAII